MNFQVPDEAQLDRLFDRAAADAIRNVASPLVFVGAGGKMGPTVAVLAKRAAEVAGLWKGRRAAGFRRAAEA